MEVQGFSCPFSGFCEGLRAFSILFCSSLAFHWYPRLEGHLFVTLFCVLLGQLARGAYMHHCMMAFRRQGTCANFLQAPYTFLLPMESSFLLVYMNLLIFNGHMDQFAFLCSERGGGPCFSLYTMWLLHF